MTICTLIWRVVTVAVADLDELTVTVTLECKDTSHCVSVPCSDTSTTAGVLVVQMRHAETLCYCTAVSMLYGNSTAGLLG